MMVGRSADGPVAEILLEAGFEVEAVPTEQEALAERFVLSIKSECLDRIVPLGERHLQRVVSEFVAYCHGERNHQELENRLIDQAPKPANANGRVLRRERLGGLLSYYHREAA